MIDECTLYDDKYIVFDMHIIYGVKVQIKKT